MTTNTISLDVALEIIAWMIGTKIKENAPSAEILALQKEQRLVYRQDAAVMSKVANVYAKIMKDTIIKANKI